MSRHNETFLVPATSEHTRLLCEHATVALTTVSDWQPAAGGEMKKVVKQGWSLLHIHNPAKLEIEVSPADGGRRVSVQASSIGFGPVQDASVKKAIKELRTAIERSLPALPPPAPASRPLAATQSTDASGDAPRPRQDVAQRLFVSYRREDSADVTGRICDALEREFGAEAIFRDVDRFHWAWIFVPTWARRSSAVTSCWP